MLLASLLFGSPAEAADPTPPPTEEVDRATGRKIAYLEREEIEFREVELEGAVIKPAVILVPGRPPTSFHAMIELRRDWNEEMKASIASVR